MPPDPAAIEIKYDVVTLGPEYDIMAHMESPSKDLLNVLLMLGL
jgi:hypothetical protein